MIEVSTELIWYDASLNEHPKYNSFSNLSYFVGFAEYILVKYLCKVWGNFTEQYIGLNLLQSKSMCKLLLVFWCKIHELFFSSVPTLANAGL